MEADTRHFKRARRYRNGDVVSVGAAQEQAPYHPATKSEPIHAWIKSRLEKNRSFATGSAFKKLNGTASEFNRFNP